MTKAKIIKLVKCEMETGMKAGRKLAEAAEAIVESVFLELRKGMILEGHVKLPNLGTLRVVTRAARMGRNPHTGEPVSIPEKKGVKFTPGKDLKKKLA